MPSHSERRRHARAFVQQAEVDLSFAIQAYKALLADSQDPRSPFCACVVMHAQQSIEKAIKGLLIHRSIFFPFTHQILRWIFQERAALPIRDTLRRRLGEDFSAALQVEALAPSLEEQGRHPRYPYLLAGKNTEYPFAPSQGEVVTPASAFTLTEVNDALRVASRVLKLVLTLPGLD